MAGWYIEKGSGNTKFIVSLPENEGMMLSYENNYTIRGFLTFFYVLSFIQYNGRLSCHPV
jgi:hypothetical protein